MSKYILLLSFTFSLFSMDHEHYQALINRAQKALSFSDPAIIELRERIERGDKVLNCAVIGSRPLALGTPNDEYGFFCRDGNTLEAHKYDTITSFQGFSQLNHGFKVCHNYLLAYKSHSDHSLLIWDLKTGQLKKELNLLEPYIFTEVSADGRYLISAPDKPDGCLPVAWIFSIVNGAKQRIQIARNNQGDIAYSFPDFVESRCPLIPISMEQSYILDEHLAYWVTSNTPNTGIPCLQAALTLIASSFSFLQQKGWLSLDSYDDGIIKNKTTFLSWLPRDIIYLIFDFVASKEVNRHDLNNHAKSKAFLENLLLQMKSKSVS